MTRLALALLWLCHFLPLPLLRALGAAFGYLLYLLGAERRRVTHTNLALCFPELGEGDRRRLARRHFVAFGQSFLDRALLWHASPARLQHLIQVEGWDNLPRDGAPTLVLTPHFLGLDAGWSALTRDRPMLSVYSQQKNPHFNAALYAGRMRFNTPNLLSRQDGMRKVVKALAEGRPFYYLPDMDFGPRDAIFVPFFGIPAATITGVARLAALGKARVVPCIAEMTPRGYRVRLLPAWEHYPSGDVTADTRRVNAFIESEVRRIPEQYYWVHKRFKTRPPGEARFY
ncbi:Lauroyl/myristoyl acyltransferase [Azospira oryzae PS]|uniref:Lauroyl/myristoyl acyltransferase n=1 Tax=Azospira oryzae (strain ATCC BAA-33 / DSM 13638 / PS) TaxID=640081 RepID=G8QGH8_AZOOP|nr:lipid A biosynthesis acyltransferase [Azospira oryzae]AEV25057.1 Lauroyl/myristoyl acyltransferase [Azospira oryzae PS]